jgi:hypothetical protein
MRLHKWSNYFEVYEKYLSKFIGKNAKVIHIGADFGIAQLLIKFLRNAEVTIITEDPSHLRHHIPNIDVLIGDASDRGFILQVRSRLHQTDIVIDGGDHINRKQIDAFKNLYEWLNPGGVYMVEATHTSYWEHYGGGLKRAGSFIEFAKDLVDQLHGRFIHHELNTDPNKPQLTSIPTNTDHIAFHDSLLVVEKRRYGQSEPEVILSGDDEHRGEVPEIEKSGVALLEERMKQHADELDRMKKSTAEMERAKREVEEQLNRHKELVQDLQGQLASSQQAKREVEEQLNRHKELVQDLQGQLASSQQAKREVEEQLNRHKELVQDLQGQLASSQQAKREVDVKLEESDYRNKSLVENLSQLETAKAEAEEKLKRISETTASTPKKSKLAKLFKVSKKNKGEAKDETSEAKDETSEAKDETSEAKDESGGKTEDETPSEKKRNSLSKLLRLAKKKDSDTEDESTDTEGTPKRKRSLANLFKKDKN